MKTAISHQKMLALLTLTIVSSLLLVSLGPSVGQPWHVEWNKTLNESARSALNLTNNTGINETNLVPSASDSVASDNSLCNEITSNSWGRVLSCQRKNLMGNIFEYTVVLKVGNGTYDKIGIHRVVTETAPWIPAKNKKAVMMVHGDNSDFDASFLSSTISKNIPKDQSIGVYLAESGIDVWGVDLRWTFVPDTTTDFSFMKNWNTTTHLKDITASVKIMRAIRLITDGDPGKVLMLGHSRGAQFVYAYADLETMLPIYLRDLKGIIPMDMAYKFDPVANPDLIGNARIRYQAEKESYDAGVFYSDEGYRLKGLAQLAAVDPDSPSPVVPGLTNKQAALFVVTATYATYTLPLTSPTPAYHYLAGTFDTQGIPLGLTYTSWPYMLDTALVTPGFQSLGEIMDGEAIWSNDSSLANVQYDKHLKQIKIPVYYVGAAGGIGQYGIYTTTLLGSSDVSTNVVKLAGSAEADSDYGHIDLLYANNAKDLVWKPVAEWIKGH